MKIETLIEAAMLAHWEDPEGAHRVLGREPVAQFIAEDECIRCRRGGLTGEEARVAHEAISAANENVTMVFRLVDGKIVCGCGKPMGSRFVGQVATPEQSDWALRDMLKRHAADHHGVEWAEPIALTFDTGAFGFGTITATAPNLKTARNASGFCE